MDEICQIIYVLLPEVGEGEGKGGWEGRWWRGPCRSKDTGKGMGLRDADSLFKCIISGSPGS